MQSRVHLLASVLQHWIYFTHKLTPHDNKKQKSKNHETFSGKSSVNSSKQITIYSQYMIPFCTTEYDKDSNLFKELINSLNKNLGPMLQWSNQL